MISWQSLAIFLPLLFVTYQTLSKFLPKDVSAFLVNAYASLIGFFIMLILHFVFSSNKSLILQPRNILIAIGIGLLIGLGNFGIIKAYNLGAPQSIFTPIFYSIIIIYGIIFGFIIWHEKFDFGQIAGTILVLVGICVIMYFKK